MRYIKVLLLVLIFFLSMVFFFQNQESLSKDMVLKLNLFFIEPMASIPLPFYFLVLMAFLLGALITFIILVWDKIHLSALHMKASWRVRSLEKELLTLKDTAQVPATTSRSVSSFFSRKKEKTQPAVEVVDVVTDVKAPDPDKQA